MIHYFSEQDYENQKKDGSYIKKNYPNFYEVFPTYTEFMRAALFVTLKDLYSATPNNAYMRMTLKLTEDEIFQLISLLDKLGYTDHNYPLDKIYPELKEETYQMAEKLKESYEPDKLEALKKILVKDFGYTKKEAERNAMDLYGKDYVVYTEKEANDALLKKISEMIDEMGLSAFPDRYQKIILKDYVINDDDFRDLYAEDVISYFNSLSEEEQKKELEKYNAESVIDYTVYRSEDDVDTDTYAEYMYNVYGDDEYFDNILLIDKEGFADYIASNPDNRGIFLSTDGEEHTMDGFVIFKKVD